MTTVKKREGRDLKGERLLVPFNKSQDRTRKIDSQEGLWCQYQIFERYPECLRAFSYFFSGPGQVSVTDNFRRKVDLCVITKPGHFLFKNYHSTLHYANHPPSCPRSEGVWENDSLDSDHSRCSSSDDECSDEDEDDDCEWKKKRERRKMRGGRGGKDEARIEDWKFCEQPCDDLDKEEESVLRRMEREREFVLDPPTVEGNDAIREYLEKLNEWVDKERATNSDYPDLHFEFNYDLACDFFHGKMLNSKRDDACYPNLEKLLSNEHPLQSITKLPRKRINEKSLLRKILLDDDMTGLVGIEGGICMTRDIVFFQQGFALTKHQTEDVDELGDLPLDLLASELDVVRNKTYVTEEELETRKKREVFLKDELRKRCRKRNLTMANLAFKDSTRDENHISTLSTQYLKFLVQHRGLRHFRIRHFVHMTLKDYHFSFIYPIIQERHRLKREKKGDSLKAAGCKLFLNSRYVFRIDPRSVSGDK